jgi:predicted acetyltransferase
LLCTGGVLTIRQLDETDLEAAWNLGRLAFGGPAHRDPEHAPRMDDALVRWGAFDARGRLVGKAVDLFHDQWWGGRTLASSGVAGVAVEPEQRGRGVTGQLMTALLAHARERGAVVSTLFPTASAVYRSVGYEVCGALISADLPTAALPRLPPPAALHVRPADGRDWPLLRRIYDEIGCTSNGLLTRRGGRWFADPEGAALPDGIDGVTLVEDVDGVPVGYASWERGRGYDDDARLTVWDLLALSDDAALALLGTLASWETVTPTLRLRPVPWADAASRRLPVERLRVREQAVWMHRPVDVAAAVAARPWPSFLDVQIGLQLRDAVCPWNAGPWRLVLANGVGSLERTDADDAAVLDVRGWSLLWCGAARTAQMRQAGLLQGGDRADDAVLDAALGGGGRAALLDYF